MCAALGKVFEVKDQEILTLLPLVINQVANGKTVVSDGDARFTYTNMCSGKLDAEPKVGQPKAPIRSPERPLHPHPRHRIVVGCGQPVDGLSGRAHEEALPILPTRTCVPESSLTVKDL
ncbi:hypothetical protein L596_025103 [Steinernema carpocapsae]|uniref:Uncharacterized protein n=1 Tax=Steinernema carpocapsae TaxID=34508 RepID=A0A4U5M6U1_STECR|nr:hypothetical protein L596_025103 [Steinernema carpocapsae]